MASSSNNQHSWFAIFHPRPTAKYQVFIFPAVGSPDPDKSLADMTDAEIVKDLKRMADPATKSIDDYSSYVEIILPMLRADVQVGKEVLSETQLNIPIIAYRDEKEENFKEPLLNRWEELTTSKNLFRTRMFPGHHNFQAECQIQVLSCFIEKILIN